MPDTPAHPPVYAIAAVARNRAIGLGGKLPWQLPGDWRHFMEQTRRGVLLMGRTSFDDMVNEPRWREDDRRYVVVTRNLEFRCDCPGVCVARDPFSALAAARSFGRTVWICGGAGIYADLLGECDRLYLTLIDHDFEADTFFPKWCDRFREVRCHPQQEDAGVSYRFTQWEPTTTAS